MRVSGHFRGKAVNRDFVQQYLLELIDKCQSVWKDVSFPIGLRYFALEIKCKLQIVSGGSMGNTFENDIMKLIFNATTIANLAINATSGPLTSLEVSLHTADPGEGGNQTSSEVTYTDYARVAVVRTTLGWTVVNNSVSPVAEITFPAGTGGSGTVTHAAIGTAHTSTGKILFSGTVTPNIVTGNGITPFLPVTSTITID